MTEQYEGGRSIEDIAKVFATNYDIYSRDLRETGLVDDPSILFADEKDERIRTALLSGAAAFFHSPNR
ncbi:MAG: hypothetical protein Q8P56_06205 [Candidatus Uhrbacteria bacterium]|nr:hypothetical protein [Candidatus Uhrbacteria bacterium]